MKIVLYSPIISFSLSDDIEPKLESDAALADFLGPNKEYQIGDLRIKTYESTDLVISLLKIVLYSPIISFSLSRVEYNHG